MDADPARGRAPVSRCGTPSGYTSGGYFNNLGRLRTLGAIHYPQKGTVRATDILFPKGVA